MRVGFAGKSGSRARAHRGGNSRLLRIIGGTWRGRKLRFAAAADIRPTPDRVRETLFNWLGGHIAGARCLDLFAGSGALGLEALSRGAAHVTFVEQDDTAARELRARLLEWQAQGAEVRRADALRYLAGSPGAALRPWCSSIRPLAAVCWRVRAGLLAERGWLSPGALIYVECAAREGPPPLPAGLAPLKGEAGRRGRVLSVRARHGAAAPEQA